MAKKANQAQHHDNLEGIEIALTRTEQFIEDNSKPISYVILAIVALVLIFIGVKRWYYNPLEKEASQQMFMAERFFDRDSFNLALNGYGTYPGFLQIVDDYGITKSANLAQYYAGICYLNMGDFNNAVDYLEDFNTSDLLVGSAKYSSLGDAYVELGDLKNAVSAYSKGIDKFPNDFTSPIMLKKEGIVYEQMGEYKKAVLAYETIKKDYSDSNEGKDIAKYIDRAKQEIKD
ncbi:MAG TPA: tetratricopeptide repeat protein [Bacteroidales bacterium]|nr:tetratricopeptide repeat protein [Bacteroidales bacterium]